jgi:hypothetical protein
MNRRSPALWLSVIVASLAGPGTAGGAMLPEVAGQLPADDVAVPVPEDVGSAGDLKLVPDSGTPAAAGQTQASPTATSEVESTGASAAAGVADRRASVPRREQMRATAKARPNHTGRRPGGSGAVSAARHERAPLGDRRPRKPDRSGAAAQARPEARPELGKTPPSTAPNDVGEESGDPLRAVGREVGDPIQLNLAAWLLLITGAAILGASRLVRHLQRSRL